MAHGKRPHVVPNGCSRKTAFTTYEAAYAAGVKVGAERAYRGKCCGWYHYTGSTQDEFAQLVAKFMEPRGVQDTAVCDTMVTPDEEVDNHEAQPDQPRETRAGSERAEPREGAGRPGTTCEQRGSSTRLAPSPAEVARRLQARGR
jgi:hypothetical protein